MKLIIQDFLDNVLGKLLYDNDVYNEFSLQHELGIYLRNELKKRGNYKVQFERNVNDTDVFGTSFSSVKKEMDIYIFNIDKEKEKVKERYAIELKFPRNGQYPEQMYSFVKDIRFMDDVKNIGKANRTFVVTLVDDEKFYSKNSPLSVSGIYQYFRAGVPITKTICKPTGKGKGVNSVIIGGSYTIKWEQVFYKGAIVLNKKKEEYRYYFHEIK